jgi:hypothetical protein
MQIRLYFVDRLVGFFSIGHGLFKGTRDLASGGTWRTRIENQIGYVSFLYSITLHGSVPAYPTTCNSLKHGPLVEKTPFSTGSKGPLVPVLEPVLIIRH